MGCGIFQLMNREWNMCMLLDIIGKVNERVIEAVKKFLTNGLSIRKRVYADMNKKERGFP